MDYGSLEDERAATDRSPADRIPSRSARGVFMEGRWHATECAAIGGGLSNRGNCLTGEDDARARNVMILVC